MAKSAEIPEFEPRMPEVDAEEPRSHGKNRFSKLD